MVFLKWRTFELVVPVSFTAKLTSGTLARWTFRYGI